MMHVMLDLETMGIGTKAAVIAIGAVKFHPRGEPGTFDTSDPNLSPYFYMNVNLQSAIDAGLTVDGATVMWWLKQSEAARERLTQDATSLQAALNEFAIWIGASRPPVWGNGAAFDCVVLRNAYLATGVYPPWGFRDERCYRTLRTVTPEVAWEPPTVAHDALQDAMAQAKHLQKIYKHLNRVE